MTQPTTSQNLFRETDGLVTAGRMDEAVALFEDALAGDPGDALTMRKLGILLTRLGRQHEGEAVLRRTVTLAPDEPAAAYCLGLNLLGQGRYAEAWPLYAERARIPALNTGIPSGMPVPQWGGEDVGGRHVVILPEQGLGDQMQFARFVPPLLARGARMTLVVPPALERLMRHSFPQVEVRATAGTVQLPRADYWTTLIGLAGTLGATVEELPPPPYLRAPGRWPNAPSGFKVGLMAAGNPSLANDRQRTLEPALVERLRAELPGHVFDLHPDRSGARDFADTAALAMELDLIVSVDTAAVHLAGALGRKCLVLLPGLGTDWRWMRGRGDTPWYPQHRLYRSAVTGEWGEAVERLIADARAEAARAA